MNPIDLILSVIAPHTCVGCGREGMLLCHECQDGLARLPSICYRCGKATRNYMACDDCKRRHAPYQVWMSTAYAGAAKELLHAYKFEERRAAARVVAVLLSESLPYFADPPIVTFVPTATTHRRARGFDHVELMARELCPLRGWHYVRTLVRTSQLQQHGASREQRKEQLKGAFRPVNERFVKNAYVLLLDDIVTTGATIDECAKQLYDAGAERVVAGVFARTMEK